MLEDFWDVALKATHAIILINIVGAVVCLGLVMVNF